MYRDDPEELKREIARLEEELAYKRHQEQQEQDRLFSEREERRRATREESERAMHTADDWPEAFWKGLSLHKAEAAQMEDYDGWWEEQIRIIEKAQELYLEGEKAVRIAVEQLYVTLRNRVADQLEAEFGEVELVAALRNDDYESLVNW